MARKFTDRSGQPWIVEREHGRSELVFRPVHGESGEERVVPLPSHKHSQDPYEFRDSELQRFLDQSGSRFKKPKGPAPF
jgi:hypothetical protein